MIVNLIVNFKNRNHITVVGTYDLNFPKNFLDEKTFLKISISSSVSIIQSVASAVLPYTPENILRSKIRNDPTDFHDR